MIILIFFFSIFFYLGINILHNILKAPSAVAQSLTITLSRNKGVKPIDIWQRLNVELGNDTLSMSHVSKWHKLFKNYHEQLKQIYLVRNSHKKLNCFSKAKTDKVLSNNL